MLCVMSEGLNMMRFVKVSWFLKNSVICWALKVKMLSFSTSSETTCPVTRCHIPNDLNAQY
jgi:hypothetical protein